MNIKYKQAEKIITSSGKFRIELGLDRISKIMNLLGNPQDKLKCIHVAGTNGKGSVCAILASLIQAYGKKVGLYSSPHIFKYTERIRLFLPEHNYGTEISEQDFAKYVFEITKLSENNNIPLTEFEILTAVMFKYFYDKNVDIVVLETGLGGRFDATNIIKSNLCAIITHIDLDHTDRLGDTKDKIAFEKAGIIKPNCPVITTEGYEAIKDKADECNSLLLMTSPFADPSELSLRGTYQQENLSLALAAIQLVFPNISQEVIIRGLHNVKHQCRFEFIEDKMLLIDGAHNPNGAKALRESLDTYFPDKKRRFVFGCLSTKDYKKMMDTLFSKGDEIYFYQYNHKQSVPIDELKNSCLFPAKEFNSLKDFPVTKDTITIICGSFYMISEVLSK